MRTSEDYEELMASLLEDDAEEEEGHEANPPSPDAISQSSKHLKGLGDPVGYWMKDMPPMQAVAASLNAVWESETASLEKTWWAPRQA
ncbi:MAG TPA: hypothetical protein EYO31_00380, partial [Phycisphaerales bacterium]|nr:hypothetical protein [Phycisphaerales bacterium]